jgi:predicted nucleotidyltransferase
MDLGRPYADVLTGARGRVLAALVRAPEPLTVRALAAKAGTSPQGTLDIVGDLQDAGIVTLVRAGRARLASLNREHLAVAPIVALVQLRLRLVEALKDHLEDWEGLQAALLFGSAARGDGHLDSDVDIVLVADDLDDPTWEEQADGLRDQILAWTGNEAQLLEYDAASFAQLVERKRPLVAEIRRDGIALTGRARHVLRSAA